MRAHGHKAGIAGSMIDPVVIRYGAHSQYSIASRGSYYQLSTELCRLLLASLTALFRGSLGKTARDLPRPAGFPRLLEAASMQ